MSLETHLIHTCTIEPPAGDNLNAYNNAKREYGVPVTGVPCRLVEEEEKVETGQYEAGAVQTVYRLIVGPAVDLQERAKISAVTLEDGTLLTDIWTVQKVMARRGRSLRHQSAILERIS